MVTVCLEFYFRWKEGVCFETYAYIAWTYSADSQCKIIFNNHGRSWHIYWPDIVKNLKMLHHATHDNTSLFFCSTMSHINFFINFIASTENTVTRMTLLLKVNSSFCIILFVYIALINQLTKCHISEESNLQQHCVKLESCKVDITKKYTLAFQIIHFRGARITHVNFFSLVRP